MPDPDALSTALRKPLLEVFPPALLGRLLVVPYYPLSDAMLAEIVRLQLARIVRRLAENHGIEAQIDESVVSQIVQRCTEVESGGRMVDAILTNTLLPQMSQILLSAHARDERYRRVDVRCEQGEFVCQFAV
jgi:type VI secretion system protein VasG